MGACAVTPLVSVEPCAHARRQESPWVLKLLGVDGLMEIAVVALELGIRGFRDVLGGCKVLKTDLGGTILGIIYGIICTPD